jgi:exodeoxyribonuclease VII small subunit
VSEKKSNPAGPVSIEHAMERLEKLVAEMESGQLPLENLIARYEEGVKLVRLCQEKLDAAEQKIQIITRNASGPTGLEDFPSGSDES